MPVDPLVVHVARLRRRPGTIWYEVRGAPAELLGDAGPKSEADSTVPAGAEIVCDVELESFMGGVMVTGTVSAPWVGVCRRCAAPVGGELVVAVRERYADPVRDGEPPDDEAYPLVDAELDLRPLARDALVLELPLTPLCRTSCKGLCPTCGADRNEEDCGCVAPRDPRWANLDVLRSSP
ncbi:MAG TPA: DUF177 domain-containing protein [Acidimicrobiales bacterium]|nr:DUF177 domain-containing protein [Acidimicrobiales bacterium]